MAANKCFARPAQNLGSIAFGSLVVSFIKWVRMMLEAAKRSNQGSPNFTVLTAAILSRLFEYIFDRFNHYAFAYIAIYGVSFADASQLSWKLIKKCGLDAIINDDIVSGAMTLGAFLVGSVTGFVAATWAYLGGIEQWFWTVGLPCAVLGFTLGYFVALLRCLTWAKRLRMLFAVSV